MHEPTDDLIHQMARRCYGYGSWDAPFWFIGPEQGMDRRENNDLTRRAGAWSDLGKPEVCDCREFHARIGITKHHQSKPPLQRTWRSMMLLLMSFLEKAFDNENLRAYQRDHWGMCGGNTCVIELGGFPARSFRVFRDRERFRAERIATIRERMNVANPALVVMYGAGAKQHYQAITGQLFSNENTKGLPVGFLQRGPTKIAFTPHSVAFGMKDAYWVELGKKLRQM